MKLSIVKFLSLIIIFISILSTHLYNVIQLRQRYVQLKLAPYGGTGYVGLFKDITGFHLGWIPKLQRLLTTGTTDLAVKPIAAQLEGFHTGLQFNQFGSTQGNKFHESNHFAENYYIWAQLPNSTDFILTTRLSFYKKNGHHVVPWFTFSYRGDSYNLPDDFESKTAKHEQNDPRIAKADGIGELYFECEIPLKKWTLTYRGLVQSEKDGKRYNVDAKFELEFSDRDVYIYQIHMDPMTMARSMSSKTWDGPFWKNLRSQAQERYASKSHGGKGYVRFINGPPGGHHDTTNRISSPEIILPQLHGSRDHNFGIRNWGFMWPGYVWWPPIHFNTPVMMDNGHTYTYFLGSFVDYGNTFNNLVVGGFVGEDNVGIFSSATGVSNFASKWYKIGSPGKYKPVGRDTVPSTIQLEISFCEAQYIAHITIQRGYEVGLWDHSFWLKDGEFEIHEAQAKFHLQFRRFNESNFFTETTAIGMFEFGKNVVGLDMED
jgi:hypothetical protein